jgi:hypothetical protein
MVCVIIAGVAREEQQVGGLVLWHFTSYMKLNGDGWAPAALLQAEVLRW